MTLPHNTIQPAPYTVWINYGSEGWSPHECATVADCLDAICRYGGQGYRITRTVTLIAAGVTVPEERAMQMVCAAMNSGRTDAEKLSRIEVVVAAWVDHPASLTPTATVEGLAGVTVAAPTCGASVVIAGVEYVCDREHEHTEPVHECTDGVGVMQWRDSDSDEGPVVVRAWTHDGSDGWPIGG